MQADETPKYCEDCRFCLVPSNGLKFARCTNPGAVTKTTGFGGDQFVARELDIEGHRYCSSTRLDQAMCGENADWFEAKAEKVAA